ncbi:hypothetical protein KK083_24730 [Fulvivirgaceae bacterium PWU4]|uniref:Uncharacterized protein n=1 Tax=Chryseosolibacter histidini TaxID=2782349 RepID=A0AAP2GRY3_9BACT|nr:hypothetical protein [Chryseosolibacter histidini]MBT1700117.1 hypothetical protein [Chryseosolibacter histidini]
MKMRLSVLACICLASMVPTLTWAQNGVEIGQMVKQTMKESWADIEPIGQDEQGAYYLMIPYSEVISGPVVGDRDFYFALINEHAALVNKKVANFSVDGKESDYEFTQEINGKIMVFSTVEEKKAKTVTFYAQELDKKNLSLTSPKKVVQLSFAKLKRDYERAIFKAEPSRDKSKLLISYSLVNDENSILTFGYVLLDAGMKEMYTWDGSLDMSDGIYMFDQFRVSNKGEVYLLTRFFDNKKDYSKNASLKKTNILSATRSMEYKANYDHRIVRFDSNGGSKIIPVPAEKTFYNALDLGIGADGNLLLIGFYSDNDENLPSGAVCLKVNTKTNTVTETGKKDFGADFLMPSDISIKNVGLAAGKDQFLSYRFILSDIQFNKNGGYTLIGERNVAQQKRNGNVFYTVNHMDDLAVIDVNAAGAITGVYKVEKSQQAVDMEIFNASYFYTEYNGSKYFAFANMGKPNFKENVLVKITPDGKQTKEVMYTTKDAEVTIRPKDCVLYKGKKLIMYGNKNNRYVRWAAKTF